MSLARTALRLSVIQALNADPVIAALCQGRVFDSRLGELSATEPVPLIVVMTEGDEGRAWSVNNGGPPFNAKCELNLEISMRAVVAPADDSGAVQIGMPYTDAEMEVGLDLLEQRAIEAVAIADTTASMLVRSTVLRRVSDFKSIRYTSDDTGAKLAARLITLTAELKGNDPAADLMATGPFASLPDPLRSVCLGLDPASSGYGVCQALASQITSPTPSIFSGVDLTIVAEQQIDPANPPVENDPTAPDPIFEQVNVS